MARHLISVETLIRHFTYRPETGVVKPRDCRKACYYLPDGRAQFGVCGTSRLAEFIAFAIGHRRLPTGRIVHVNGDRLDNRLENLFECP